MMSHVLASRRLRLRLSSDTLLIFAVWAAVAAMLVAQQWPALVAYGPTDPDAQMRLIEVRDYLSGAAWSDLRQMRLNPPDGVLMHWSRLIDWPIAGLIRLSQPVLGRDMAELFAISAWPLALLLVFFFGMASVGRRLAGSGGVVPAVAFAAFAAPATAMFVPGHITHHNAQIALFSILLALAVRIDRGEIVGVFAGIAAAIMLAIGLETLPLVGMIAAGLTLTWAFAPASTRAGLNGFGLFFAAGMVVQRAFTAAPSDWLAVPCDIASAPYIIVAVIGGVGIAALARLNPPLALRFVGIAVIGCAALAAVALINPQCLAGPYAEIDPRIRTLWLDHVGEAQSFGQIAAQEPWRLIGLYLAPFLALVPTSWAFACAGRSERAGWGLVLMLLMTALAVAMWQSRGATFASALVVPGMTYAVIEVRRWSEHRNPVVLAVALLLVYTVPNAAAETIVAGYLRDWSDKSSGKPDPARTTIAAPGSDDAPAAAYLHCAARGNFAGLSVQPAGTVLIESNLGPSLLLNTPHATLAAPYHRDAAGIVDGFTAFEGSFAIAYDVIARRHVAYVATCPTDPEVDLIRSVAPHGFLPRLLAGDVPEWLQSVPVAGPLKVWRVIDPTLASLPDRLMTGAALPRQRLQPGIPDLRGSLAPTARP